MFDVCAIGDALIDFKPVTDCGRQNCVEANAGGTAANLVCACARMGLKSAMLGKVGSDHYGTFLLSTLRQYGVSTEGMIVDQNIRTTLAFVHPEANGERSFSFFRNPGADMMYHEAEIDYSVIDASKIFYFSSMALTDEPERTACRRAVEYAKSRGKLICCDVNLRINLWKDPGEALRVIREYIRYADILKLSEEELFFVCGQRIGLEEAVDALPALCSPALLVVSLGENGCRYRTPACRGSHPGYRVKAVDTVGAGDISLAGLLAALCGKSPAKIQDLSETELSDIFDFANAAGAVSVTRTGSITSAPDTEEIRTFLKQRRVG